MKNTHSLKKLATAASGMPKKQKGIALTISIVFLLILSISGVSAIRNSSFDQKMTNSIQSLLHAFQYAESGIASAIRDSGMYDVSYTKGGNTRVNTACENADGSSTQCTDSGSGYAETAAYYEGEGKLPPANYSLDEGIAKHFFEITSTGTANKASSTHRQGLFIVGPSGSN